jgi:hypothetical protein
MADEEVRTVVRSLCMLSALSVMPMAIGQTTCDAGPSQTSSVDTLRLRVYNSAKVARGNLNDAIELAQTIISHAGVSTCWDRASEDPAEALFTDLTGAAPSQRLKTDERGHLAVRIIRGEPDRRFPGALGIALPFAKAGPHAFVYYDTIERLSVPSSVTRILGHALAHEIGHVLLETTKHSEHGLMKARWSKLDFQRTAVSFLEFSSDQGRNLQDGALRRAGNRRYRPLQGDHLTPGTGKL